MAKSEVSTTQKMLNVWAIVLIVWSFYRATFKASLPIWFDEFIAKPAVFLIPIFWFITRSEKKSFLKGLGFSKKNWLSDSIFGLMIGGLFFGVAILTRITKGLPFPSFHFSSESLIWVLSTGMAAGMEQILSTGFVFNRLSAESKNILRPLIISALLFFFLHVPVLFGAEKISGSTLIQIMILNTVISITTSIVFLLRKNTIAPIIVYALYLLSLPILL
jgi:hypothetical protein